MTAAKKPEPSDAEMLTLSCVDCGAVVQREATGWVTPLLCDGFAICDNPGKCKCGADRWRYER